MTQPLEFAVDALAVQRLTRLVGEDTILEKPRDWVLENGPDWASDLLTCPHCLSVWLGAGAVAARKVAPRAWNAVATALALSAVTSLKTEITETLGG